MKERPILFNAAMVNAILNGSKTQTRRIINPQPYQSEFEPSILHFNGLTKKRQVINGKVIPKGEYWSGSSTVESYAKACQFGYASDQLWVRETFTGDKNNFGYRADAVCGSMGYDGDGKKIFMKHGYILDETCKQTYQDNFEEGFNTYGLGHFSGKWKPSIHMPRWASRIQLEITNVGVEHLQSITYSDAIAEGVIYEKGYTDPRHAYKFLWETINGEGSWDANPWVWVIEF